MMRLQKIVVAGIERSKMSELTWKHIEQLCHDLVFADLESTGLKDADGLLVGFDTAVNQQAMNHAPNLKYIGVLGTAFDRIDVVEARKRGIVVTNLPGYSTEAVAEFVFGALLVHLRKLDQALAAAKRGEYSGTRLIGSEIRGKVFGVVGLGQIGSRVAEIALGFGAQVRYWSRSRKKDAEQRGIGYQELDAMLSNADIVSLHVAGSKETEHVIDAKKVSLLKLGTVIVNTVSMKVFNIDALERRLSKGDVTLIRMHSRSLSDEQWQRLSKLPNFIVYPAITNLTNEANHSREEMFVGNIKAFLAGKPQHVVN